MSTRAWPTGVGLAILLLAGCGVRVAPEETLVFRYSEGIQSLHEPTYETYFLACHPEKRGIRLSERLSDYETTRRNGSVTFSPDGVEIIKLGALGRGAYFRVREVVPSADTLQFKTLLRPDYLSINFTQFPDGAVLYILQEPLGLVLPLKPGKAPGPPRRVLRSVDLDWTWTKQPVSPPGWCLLSVVPVAETADFQTLQFREAAPSPATGAQSP